MGFIIAVSRLALPTITVILIIKCVLTLWLGHPKEKTYGYIVDMHSGSRHELNMWETSIGRSATCDIVLNYDSVARSHIVITRRIDGWYIYDVTSNKTPIKINGNSVQKKQTISAGDIITLGSAKFRFEVIDDPVQRVGKQRKRKKKGAQPQRQPQPVPPKQAQPVQQTPPTKQQKTPSAPAPKPGPVFIDPSVAQKKIRKSVQHCIINKDTGETFVLCGTQISIGSSRRCDIRLQSLQCAKKHAYITLFEDGWAIENIPGADTYLNGKQVTSPCLLFKGDVIALADERLYYEVITKTIT